MAIKKNAKAEKKEVKASFKEFKFSGDTFEYSGRVYPPREGKGKIVKTIGMTLTLNGKITIKGVKIVETESDIFFSWPQYSTDNGYQSYFYIDKDLNDELDLLIEKIIKMVDNEDQIASSDGKDLPF